MQIISEATTELISEYHNEIAWARSGSLVVLCGGKVVTLEKLIEMNTRLISSTIRAYFP